VTSGNTIASHATLAALEREFGWTCWHDGDQYYARRPTTPHGEHDARGDDPTDLREAITLALQPTSTPTEHADLATLATELTTRGYQTTLRTPAGAPPHLHVINPRATALSERVYAHGGNYYYSWGVPICPTAQPATAATALTRVLRTTGE
jgi:hypothetical protein